jgi:UMF1 family MFS transporter
LVASTSSVVVFYVIGGVVGALLGALWASSRPWLLSLTPAGEEGRIFGLYAFANKAAAIVGPIIWGLIVLLFDSLGPARYRLAIAVLAGICAVGAWLLVRVPAGTRPAVVRRT